MKMLLALGLTIATPAFASDYSGVWEDQNGTLYSINHKSDTLAIGELRTIKKLFSPSERGNYISTGKELDLSVQGNAFFVLEKQNGEHVFTVDGQFHLSENNEIVNAEGLRLVTKNKISIPNSTDGLVPVQQNGISDISGCSAYWGCPPEIEETGRIIISAQGVIQIRNDQTGEKFEIDQIQLAWIPPGKIQFSGYPIALENNDSGVSYFYSQGGGKNVQGYFGATIAQGMIEQTESEDRLWNAYLGVIVNNSVTLSPVLGNGKEKELLFYSEEAAVIKTSCDAPAFFCQTSDFLMDKELVKVY